MVGSSLAMDLGVQGPPEDELFKQAVCETDITLTSKTRRKVFIGNF